MSDVESIIWTVVTAGVVFAAASLITARLYGPACYLLGWQERRYDQVLNRQLLMDVEPRLAMYLTGLGVLGAGLFGMLLFESWFAFWVVVAVSLVLPHIVLSHMEQKRRAKLELQLVDGITSLASGVRAGLTLVQSMQLLAKNSTGPIKQEIEHMLREYELGVDIGQAMHNASNRIRSPHYRLLFSAIQVHLQRGGDVADSLDRIGESVREIQRLDGKLQSLTAQGRSQAWMMAGAGVAIMGIGYLIAPIEAERVITDPAGRFILLFALVLVGLGAIWIRKIMSVDM